MIETILAAAISIISLVLPFIVKAIQDKQKETDALTRRSLDELHAVDGMQPPPSV